MDLTNLKIPELLAPGGGPAKARTAILYGADAVYVGGQGLNLRAKAAGFTWDDLDFLLAWAHKRGARVYYCLNAMIRAQDLSDVESSLECLGSKDVDGLIAADPGIIRMARKHAPHIPLHLSTQVSTSNPEAALLWRDLGISRVNLARELSLQEIRPFSSLHGILETELFVHGALCMAVSGRCLLSAYLNARPANLGLCTHPCRYEYRMVRMSVEERKRKGEILWEIEEQDDYTRLFAAKDLCLLPYLKWICSARISALKIEGRMKSVAYLSQVVDVYRTALQA
ncbi:MAG: peptidase U32 family protein, partial [Desulfovibrionales bacterium]